MFCFEKEQNFHMELDNCTIQRIKLSKKLSPPTLVLASMIQKPCLVRQPTIFKTIWHNYTQTIHLQTVDLQSLSSLPWYIQFRNVRQTKSFIISLQHDYYIPALQFTLYIPLLICFYTAKTSILKKSAYSVHSVYLCHGLLTMNSDCFLNGHIMFPAR
jgi:hypothetical protein